MNTLPDKTIVERLNTLSAERKKVLALPPAEALDRILEASQPAALVHSMPEEDLYLLIQEIGHEDALPILALASIRQWEFLVDMEVWNRDRINLEAVTKWMNLLLKADSNRLIKWVVEEKVDFLEYYLFKNLQVVVRQHDQDPSDFGDGFITYDDTFYFRIMENPLPAPSTPDASVPFADAQRKAVLSEIVKRLSDYDQLKYQGLLLEASGLIPAEVEEENYRLRNVRLAERGFQAFDDAIGIYQRLSPDDLKGKDRKYTLPTGSDAPLAVPYYATQLPQSENLFAQTLSVIDQGEMVMQIQTEFAILCNQIISADQKRVSAKGALGTIIKKGCGYLTIGLESIAGASKDDKSHRYAALIQKHLLADIFRVGYGRALELKWQAENWRKKSWGYQTGLPLSFYGEEWVGVLGGLLIKKPLYFDNYQTGVLYREFEKLDEVKQTQAGLNEMMAFDRLLSMMEIANERLTRHPLLTYKNLLLTLWVRNETGLSRELDPVGPETFGPFFEKLWVPDQIPRRIKTSSKTSFLNWLSNRTGLKPFEISERVGPTLENLFGEIESELGPVAAQDLDPRYVHLFLLQEG
ncbi:MAG: DUF6178 family protein [Desulfobacterales bacterium]